MVDAASIPEVTSSDSKRQKPSRSTQKLSEERLARKRALDREAQRSSRCKTKNHIALLESRIEALTRVQDNGNTKELVDQIEQQRIENEALRARLKSIAKLVTGHAEEGPDDDVTMSEKPAASLPSIQKSEPDLMMMDQMGQPRSLDLSSNTAIFRGSSDSNNSSPENIEQSYQLVQKRTLHDAADPGLQIEAMYDLSSVTAGPMGQIFSPDHAMPQQSLEILDQPLWGPRDLCTQVTQCRCSKIKNFTSQLLSQCSNLQIQTTANQNLRDADIPIRAVLHGWHAVTRKYLLDPMWSMLRHADEIIFSKCGATERLIVLRNLALQLRYRANPTQQNLEAVPFYLHERPSQRFIPHESLIDYIVWPGLRERFVFAPHRYCSERFTALFWKCFRFTWDYEFRDVYVRDPETGQYMFSKSFDECSRDLSSFCMTHEFLDEFPELRADITATEEERDDHPHMFENMKGMFGVGELELGDVDVVSMMDTPIFSSSNGLSVS